MPIGPTGATIESPDLCNGAVVERVLEDGSVSAIKITKSLESENWDGTTADADDATQGWRLEFNTDTFNIQNAIIRGTIYATAGEISGQLVTDGLDAKVITVGDLTLTGQMLIKGGGGAALIDSTGVRANKVYGGNLVGVGFISHASETRVEITPNAPEQFKFFDSLGTELATFGAQPSIGVFLTGTGNFGATIVGGAEWAVGTSFQIRSSGVVRLSVEPETDSIKLYVNGVLQTVTEGAVDSGGSGFRVLRIPN